MPAIVLVMALLGAVLEFPAIVRGPGLATLRQRPHEFFLASTLGFCINFLTLGIIDRLSSLWFKLLGQLKNVGVVYLSVLLFGSTVTATQSLGYVIAIGGFLCYSHVKAEASKAAAARKERSALDGGRGEEGKPAGPKGGLKGAQP